MKIFSWMQSKLNGTTQVMKKQPAAANSVTANNHMGEATSKEEFSDWPQSLLAIGTFGHSNLRSSDPEAPCQSHPQTAAAQEEETTQSEKPVGVYELDDDDDLVLINKDDDMQRICMFSSSRLPAAGGKDMILVVDQKKNNNNNVMIRKKSLTFLLKRIFTSKNRLNRGSLPVVDPTFDKSTMDKILRAILNKKIHPQTSPSKGLPNNKYLTRKDVVSVGERDDEISEAEADDNEGSMWVKTDSEYIVLEI